MLIRPKLILSIVASGLLAAAALAADGFTLKFAPKADTTFKFKVKGEFDFNGTTANFSANDTWKIVKVEDSGNYQVEDTESAAKVTFGGQDMEPPASPATTTTYSPNGAVVLIKGENDDASAYRLANLSLFIYPDKAVSVGDKWTYAIKPDAKTGAVESTANYEVVGEEKVGTHDTVKVKFTIKEKGASDAATTDGTTWIEKTTGVPVKVEAKWTNVPMPKAQAPLSGTISYSLVD